MEAPASASPLGLVQEGIGAGEAPLRIVAGLAQDDAGAEGRARGFRALRRDDRGEGGGASSPLSSWSFRATRSRTLVAAWRSTVFQSPKTNSPPQQAIQSPSRRLRRKAFATRLRRTSPTG